MKHSLTLLVVAFVVACVPAVGLAQVESPGEAMTLTLDEAIARGLANSHRIAEVSARGEAADAAADQRHAALLPQLTGQASYTRTNHVEEFGFPTATGQLRVIYPDVPDNYLGRLDVRWPIYTAGRFAAIERAARIEAGAIGVDRAALQADLKLEITRAYWSVATATETARVVEASLERTRAHLIDARNQLEAGVAAPNDVLTIEAQQASQQVQIIRANAARDAAEADLARLVGAPLGTRIQLSPVADPVPAPVSRMSIDALIAEARDARSDRSAIVERVSAARVRVEAAAAGLKPTIAIGGGLDYGRPNPRIFPREDAWHHSWDASVNVSVPIADGGRSHAEVAEARAALRALEARLAEFDSVMAVEITQRMRDVDSAQAAIEAAAIGIRAANEAHRVAEERFGAGVATNTDVLVAQNAVLQAELDRTEAAAALRIARARLDRSLGR